jgi:3-deoxy-D-manno-octulosonic-acid transferase
VRRLYTLLLYLALPVVVPAMALRAWREHSGFAGWRQRFGFGPHRAGGGIWIHAASVGEAQAAAILIEALRGAQYRDREITLTCMTATGRARARALLPEIDVRYAPYDLPGCVRRTLQRLKPRLLVVMETELWPNLLHQAAQENVQILLASARISARTAGWHRRLTGLLQPTLRERVWVAAQSTADAQRFLALGVPRERVGVSGNLKFDRRLAPDLATRGAALRARYASGRPLWVAGSTQEGEEPIVLAAHRQLREHLPAALLVLAPRYPQRFDSVVALVQETGQRLVRRSRSNPEDRSEVLVLDTLGELMDFYAAADVAFVGGSLVPIGGHNLLEPAAIGLPVLSGPHQFNSPDIARTLNACGALTTVTDASSLATALLRLLSDPELRARQGRSARAAIEANRGALAGLLATIEALLPTAASSPVAAAGSPSASH